MSSSDESSNPEVSRDGDDQPSPRSVSDDEVQREPLEEEEENNSGDQAEDNADDQAEDNQGDQEEDIADGQAEDNTGDQVEDIFGSESSDDDEKSKKPESRRDSSASSPVVRRFGDDDSRDEDIVRMAVDDEENERSQDGQQEEVEVIPERVDHADIPRIVADLGNELYFIKFPNFLSVETHPYDPKTYDDEIDEDEVQDEEGKGRLKLKVENTIRWRTVVDRETGEEKKESNARIVRWSDGTFSLHLGSEIFEIHKQAMMSGENHHLFVRQGVGLHGQAVFRTKLSFRPHSTESLTHRKVTYSMADKSRKTHRILMLPKVGNDPEANRLERIKREEDLLKASQRRENQSRRTRERAHARGPTASYLEGDFEEEDDEGGISLSAIKSNIKKRDFSAAYVSDSDDGSDLDIGRKSSDKKRPAVIEESDDDD